ncbi:hemerythrin domain-containing protein [Sphingomonas qomolangmaensis]|uniref:Hemerythrin domain-containing protein n=1 Tax=Sphingomonas qomolangmaensis TaxID=2918765 RepID=A0ABY5L705_9SPHN|nr:hemerythrin domain-containing protein [Sphingomonas qomolangmaensis]UUL82735.1 hemerythrin domain-containing protein [Sphingomonas qomolangmaensis]
MTADFRGSSWEDCGIAEDNAHLGLAARSSIDDSIAYLLAAHPQAGWRAHANFGQLADFWLHVHGSLRGEGAEVARVVDRFRDRQLDPHAFERAFVPRLNGFLGHLEQHHQIEDAAYFPKFKTIDPRMVAGFDLLEADHALIHELLLNTVDDARALLAALALPGDAGLRAADAYAQGADRFLALMLRHLADEEEIVIPALLEHGERPLL